MIQKKGKLINWTCSKLKIFVLQKATLKKKKGKRQVTDWEKLFAKHVSDNGFVSRIHKDYLET